MTGDDNGGSSSQTQEFTSSVVCSATTQTENGETNAQNMTFAIADNKLGEVTLVSQVTDANGTVISDSTSVMALEKVVSDSTVRGKLVSEDGTLLVTEDVLSGELQTALNTDGTVAYTCVES